MWPFFSRIINFNFNLFHLMKQSFLLLITLHLTCIVHAQYIYSFIGNGNWTTISNWRNNNIPPAKLPDGSTIDISPAIGDSCVLNIFQTIADGAILNIKTGAKFIILGDLKILKDSVFTDVRDGNMYPYRHIGTQVWMTKNLNYDTVNAFCYDKISGNCDVYGRLYNWYAALKVAPPGWHLPSDSEWTVLTTFLGGLDEAGGAMKSRTGWNAPNTNANNSSGFSGLPAGIWSSPGFFEFLGTNTYWWSSTELDTMFAWRRSLNYYFAPAYTGTRQKIDKLSVRCIRDY